MRVPHDRHHKVSSLIKVHKNTPISVNNTVKHEVLIKQYLRTILDISGFMVLLDCSLDVGGQKIYALMSLMSQTM